MREGGNQLYEVQRILDGNKASLRKTYWTEPEANDEGVQWSRSSRIYERYAEVGKAMLDVDREVDDECDMTDDAAKMVMEPAEKADAAAKMVIEAEKTGVAVVKLGKARERHRNVAQVFDKVNALSCGTGDRTENEKFCLEWTHVQQKVPEEEVAKMGVGAIKS